MNLKIIQSIQLKRQIIQYVKFRKSKQCLRFHAIIWILSRREINHTNDSIILLNNLNRGV